MYTATRGAHPRDPSTLPTRRDLLYFTVCEQMKCESNRPHAISLLCTRFWFGGGACSVFRYLVLALSFVLSISRCGLDSHVQVQTSRYGIEMCRCAPAVRAVTCNPLGRRNDQLLQHVALRRACRAWDHSVAHRLDLRTRCLSRPGDRRPRLGAHGVRRLQSRAGRMAAGRRAEAWGASEQRS